MTWHNFFCPLGRGVLGRLGDHRLVAGDTLVACWAFVLARFLHTDEVVLGLACGQPGAWSRVRIDVPPEETLQGLIAESHRPHASLHDADPSGPVQCLVLMSRGDAFEAPRFAEFEGAMVCSFSIDDGACTGVLVGYDPRRHDSKWIAVLAHHFGRLLEALCQSPAVAQVEWLQGAEREKILRKWNGTARSTQNERCLHWLFEEQAQRTPKAVAAEFDGASLSYKELDARAAHIAQYLLRLGVGPGSFVPLCAERSLSLVVGVLAILKTGAAYVPVDPTFPPAHTRRVFEDCQPQVVLLQRRFSERLPVTTAKMIAIEEVSRDGAAPPHAGNPRDIACVMYTSGSTGEAKGALIDHRSLVNNILWLQDNWPLDASDAMLQKTPFTFDVSIKELLWPLATGARIVFARPGGHLDMRHLARLIADRGVTVAHFVPSMLQRFLDAPVAQLCQTLKLVMCGAEILPPRLKDRFFGLFDAKLLHLYGPTEAAISVTGWECQAGAESGSVVPLGRPMSHVQIYLLDRAGRPVPAGVPGEIHIGGLAVARGYLKRPELTRERFLDDRFTDQAEKGLLYRTGDLARFRGDGVIEFIGRIDQQVKIHGARVEPREIEVALNGHPQVKRAAVRPYRDRFGDTRLIAYVIPENEPRPSVFCLRQYCAAQLPSFMVPAAFVILDEMPLLTNGKIDYSLLPAVETTQ